MVNSDVVYQFIRGKIFSGEYPPGSLLNSQQLSAEVGVSRTSVREALRQLEVDGLVVIRPHHGASVRTMDLQELIDLCGLRQALATYAAEQAAMNRTGKDLEDMRKAYAKMNELAQDMIQKKAGSDSYIQQFFAEDIRFHRAILTAAGNPFIKKESIRIQLLDQVMTRKLGLSRREFRRSDREARMRRSQRCHGEILDAIEKQDGEQARKAMDHHLQVYIEKYRQVMDREKDALVIAAHSIPSIEETNALLADAST